MRDTTTTDSVTSVPKGVDGAVGVPGPQWYIACMKRPRTEKAVAERLDACGLETYVATQKQMRVWRNGRRKTVDTVVIPSVIFLHCTDAQRLEAAHDPGISRFMMNRATEGAGASKVATIPAVQIERLKFMLGQSDIPVTFTERIYRSGDRVRVVRGNLAGLEGRVLQAPDGKSELLISVDLLGSARLTIDPLNLEPIQDGRKSQA